MKNAIVPIDSEQYIDALYSYRYQGDQLALRRGPRAPNHALFILEYLFA